MKALKRMLIGILVVAAAATPVWIHLRGQAACHAKSALLQQQALNANRLRVENAMLSNIVAKAENAQTLSQAELSELLRLRNELGQLRSLLGETNGLTREIAQLRGGVKDLQTEKENSDDSPTALLDAQTQLRSARLARLHAWLADRPAEIIPELQLLPEDSWLKSAEWTRVTDEEYASWISAQRGNAEMKFASMAYKALKQYAAANKGGFPAELSELKPYFETPVADAIIDRYRIVPVKSLPLKFLQEAGRDWVITEKAPVNRKYDGRIAVSATDHRYTLVEGRWDDVP